MAKRTGRHQLGKFMMTTKKEAQKKAYNKKGKNSYACYDIDELLFSAFYFTIVIVFARSWEVMTNFRK